MAQVCFMSSMDLCVKHRSSDVGIILLHSRNQELELSWRKLTTGGSFIVKPQ